jgi:dihydrofolate synthase/folylpolyglutamate synthase
MTYQESLRYLSELEYKGIHMGLGPLSNLLHRLCNPHGTFATVLIGGTNGKGSISAMVASILLHGGFRVGLYTSPHLTDIRERIRINGAMISPEEMASCISTVKQEITQEVTYFEFLTAVAFLYFSQQQVDIAILEVGMGGRLDATNIVSPLACVISNVSIDHQAYLGKRLEDIAREKGGIVKNHGLCITAERKKNVIGILEGICRVKKARLYRLGKDIGFTVHNDGTFSCRGISKQYAKLTCSLMGRHQIENATMAIAAVESIMDKGFSVEDRAVFDGIQAVKWEGRLEVLCRDPMLVVDGAHNPAGISVLCRALRNQFSYKRLIVIFGVFNDKNYKLMLKRLVPLAHRFVITRPCSQRATPVEELLPVAMLYKTDIEEMQNAVEAVKKEFTSADQGDLICVTGSLYLVGEIKKAFSEILDYKKMP